jgi:hypothetical protein
LLANLKGSMPRHWTPTVSWPFRFRTLEARGWQTGTLEADIAVYLAARLTAELAIAITRTMHTLGTSFRPHPGLLLVLRNAGTRWDSTGEG